MEKPKENDARLDNESPSQDESKKNIDAIIKHDGNTSFNTLNLFDEKQLKVAEVLLTKMMKSKKGGFSSVEEGLAILMRANDLKLPFSSCIEHIHVINNKTGVDIHIIKALLLRAGCKWRCLKDYQPLYEYTDGFSTYIDGSFPEFVVRCSTLKEAEDKRSKDEEKGISDFVYVYPVRWYKDFNGNLYKDYQLNTKQFGIAINKQQVADIAKSGRIPVYRVPNNPVDYITEYEITRTIDGERCTSIGHFSYSEALQAEMFEKDNYKKYPRIMIGHRAFTLAARDIASDILFGVMETTELKVATGKDITDSDLETIEIEAEEIN